MICRSCGALIKDNAARCPHCKQKEPDLYRGRKESDYERRAQAADLPPDHPAYRTGSTVPSQTNPLTRQETASHPAKGWVTVEDAEDIWRPDTDLDDSHTLADTPAPIPEKYTTLRQTETKSSSGIASFVIWIIVLFIFIIVMNSCDGLIY